MGGCFSSSSHEQGREQNEISLKGTAQQRADLIKRSMRDGVGLPAKSEPSLRHGLSGAGSFYSKERVPSKPALKSPGSMRRAKIDMDLPDDTANMEESSDIIAVRPRQTDSTINSPQPSPLSLHMLDVSNCSPLLSPVHGQGSNETITELSNTDSIRGNSDPTGRGLLMLHERPQSASFTRRSETQDQLMPLGGSVSNIQWPLTPRDNNVRTMSERPNSLGSSSSTQFGTFKRLPSVRIAVMGRVQEPGEWEGSGPSSIDRESKTSGSKSFKRNSRLAGGSGSSGSPSGSSRLTGTGSVRGSITISSKSRSDLADLAHI